MYKTLKSPLNIQVEITEECNNICRHCYNFFRHKTELGNRSIKIEEIEYLVAEFKKLQVVRLTITGGEPLSTPEKTIYLAKKSKEIGMSVTLNSNLTIFDKKLGEKLKNSGISVIMTSLLSHNPNTHDYITQSCGSWGKTTENIKLATDMGFRVLVNMVLTKWNILDLKDTGNFVGYLGVAKFGATRACAPIPIAKEFTNQMISLDELRGSLKILYELKEKWGYDVDVFEHYPWCALQDVEKYSYLARRKCTAGITSASVGYDGELRPCGHSNMRYGNVFKEGLQRPWLRMDDWRETKYSNTRCNSCPLIKMCTGGCPTENINSEKGIDHHCTTYKDITTLPKKKILCDINPNEEFIFYPNTVLRTEEFGGILIIASGGQILLDKEAFDIVSFLFNNREGISVNKLVGSFKATQNESNFLINRLINEGLIKTNKGGGKT
ncbi:MAG: hypothetical protein Athens071416_451 [Parcubacteria group bacterium Athens0714_16]|nr:MAG: hypothetical protein Athens071416_451 [Parcubacteria group bacterium Athens0714_16]